MYLGIPQFREIRRRVVFETFHGARKCQTSHKENHEQKVREQRREVDNLKHKVECYHSISLKKKNWWYHVWLKHSIFIRIEKLIKYYFSSVP